MFRCSVARRCVGWAYTAIMCLIWELDMADWLGSRATPKYLCCNQLCYNSRPKQTLGYRHTHSHALVLELARIQVAHPPPSPPCCEPSWLNSFCEFCHFSVLKRCCRKRKRGITSRLCSKCDRAVHKRSHTHTHTHTHIQAHTRHTEKSSHLAARERWHIIKPSRWCTEPHRHLQLVLFQFLLWISVLVSWRAYRWKTTICSICKFNRAYMQCKCIQISSQRLRIRVQSPCLLYFSDNE